MAHYYNLTAMEAARNLGEFATAASTLTKGLVFYMILIVVAVVTFITLSKNNRTSDVMIVDGFIVTLISSLMWAGGWIAYWLIGPPLVLMLAGIAINFFGD